MAGWVRVEYRDAVTLDVTVDLRLTLRWTTKKEKKKPPLKKQSSRGDDDDSTIPTGNNKNAITTVDVTVAFDADDNVALTRYTDTQRRRNAVDDDDDDNDDDGGGGGDGSDDGDHAADTSATTSPPTLTVMSANLWNYNHWPARRALLLNAIRREQPDVIGFQEVRARKHVHETDTVTASVTATAAAAALKAMSRDAHESERSNPDNGRWQVTDLATGLPGYQFAYAPAMGFMQVGNVFVVLCSLCILFSFYYHSLWLLIHVRAGYGLRASRSACLCMCALLSSAFLFSHILSPITPLGR
jgi:hypothetical protein